MLSKEKKRCVMKKYLYLVLLFSLTLTSCSVYQTMVNLSRLKFKLGDVTSFKLNGVNISNKSKLGDFTPQEIISLSSAVAQGKLPISFVLNIEAKNPNDGTGGYPKTNALIKSFPWRLLIDNKQTISGSIGSEVSLPGTGQITNIPVEIGLDLVSFFKDRGYESLINLALSIGGSAGSSSNLTLYAKPTVTSVLGDITYPQEIKIVSMDFSN
jgi:hypothetical protein